MISPWKSFKEALASKRKNRQSAACKAVFEPRNYYYVGPTCITTSCDIFPRRMGVKATAPQHCSEIQDIVRHCTARFLMATGNKAQYMIGYDTVMMSLPKDILNDFLDYVEECFGDDAPLRMITDQILLKHVGTFPGLDYYETRWTYDCKLVRYEDLLILRFRPKARMQ